ncbi:hypothetical protein DIC82_11490 [Clostridium beijerinckii]|nr:hypothetical protein DIC82_11490 [Clostridium beijerinckii]
MVMILEKSIKSTAIVSDDGNYRYRLTRVWDNNKQSATVIMLNPSKANELKSDKTVMNLTNFLIDNNFGSVNIVNLFSYMTTDPSKLHEREEQFERYNNTYIELAFEEADIIIIAWVRDNKKYIKNRKIEIEKILIPYKSKTKCFMDSEGIKPRHPRDLGDKWTLEDYDFMYIT